MAAIRSLLQTSPGLPRPDSTNPYWLEPLHPLAKVQSSVLPSQVDTVVIGSGITGVSVAKTLLESDPSVTVAVLEARTLCSGATGRNGGHLITPFALSYGRLKSTIGKEDALRLLAFCKRNVATVAELATSLAPTESQVRPVTRLRTYTDKSLMDVEMLSIAEYEADFPASRGEVTFVDADECIRTHGIHGVVGAAKFSGHAVWPYRLIMKVWETLHQDHRARFFLEAMTPVEEILHDATTNPKFPYSIRTPRGIVQACQIVHCTNAWASHLLPRLRGRLFPYLECMTVQTLGGVPSRANQNTWSFHEAAHRVHLGKVGKADMGAVTETVTTNGWFYLQQLCDTDEFLFGGQVGSAAHTISADDSYVATNAAKYLQHRLCGHFGVSSPSGSTLHSFWTGVIGRTVDAFPLVGHLPVEANSRTGDGEWIAAGFNGGGMAFCWLVGQAVAEMVLGRKGPEDWLPPQFAVTADRYRNRLPADHVPPEFVVHTAHL